MVQTKTTPKASKPKEPITPSQTHEPSAPQLLSPNLSSSSSPSFSVQPRPTSPSALGSDSVPGSGTVRRRSVRLLLASQMDLDTRALTDSTSDSCRERKGRSGVGGSCPLSEDGKVERKVAGLVGASGVGHLDNEELGLDSRGSGTRVLKVKEKIDDVRVDLLNKMNGNGSESGQCGSSSGIPGSKSRKAKGKRELSTNVDLNSFECRGDDRSKGFLSLRSGKKILKRGMDSATLEGNTVEESESQEQNNDDIRNGISVDEDGSGGAKRAKKMSKEKGKKEMGNDDLLSNEHPVHRDGSNSVVRRGKRKVSGDSEKADVLENVVEGPSSTDVLPNVIGKVELGVESSNGISDINTNHLEDNAAPQDQEQLRNTNTREHGSRRNGYMERFRDIARENASRFAHFAADEEPNGLPNEAEVAKEIEDWPGPFSTAMKIIKDRTSKSMQTQGASSERSLPATINWAPKKNEGQIGAIFSIPSLRELCLNILAKNADAIVSLDSVPDAIRHKLSQLLCDSRKMNNQFFELLLSGSPTEIRLRDCSWMTEDQFTKSFQMCNTSSLVVLQLDQCGRCLPDYVLLATLAQAPRHLPRLTSLSLSGACRLSDVGLSSLVSSAPALQSINLSQCSLLTSTSLYILADSLGSLLKELYLDDCQSIDATLILPALVKLEHLEVLSVAGIQTVCDDFIKDYITLCGHNMKELILKDCVNLTDSSMEVIVKHCPGLCALDLRNLSKLTDSSMAYLTNGCHGLHMLKLCRNPFSDEAIAAFLETTGESLRELSLNNVNKVGHHTALSLAGHAKNLHTLDLSWCRNLTDNAITDYFLNGHSNPEVQIIGLKMSPLLQHVKAHDTQQYALHYSSASSQI
ncbi:DNA repair protein rhp7-like isoform X2 [Senna tora]|uniref:DNA repair protein rhp7-like isoform X2 n=1 Tax=Senna tora TaxID=362788 RepID=A0A834X253_9FABA|nr:DNA repair protein rhp7-like isoform X2 [Senna tora]